jgi:hypothetical protein
VNVVVPGAIETPSRGLDKLDEASRRAQILRIGERTLANRMLTATKSRTLSFSRGPTNRLAPKPPSLWSMATIGALAGSPRFKRGEVE